jgi:predicted DNA binding CopG/RHH family protein
MMEDPVTSVPKFMSEAEEAQWWFEHQDFMLEEFKRAQAEGRLGIGTAKRRLLEQKQTPSTSIRLDPADIAKARVVAERKGLKYQTYLKMLIHEALEKETIAT